MKKLTFIFLISLVFLQVNAQTSSKSDIDKPQLTRDSLFVASFQEAGLSSVQIEKAKTVVAGYDSSSNIITSDPAMTAADKKLKLKAESAAMKTKLKAIMGNELYIKWAGIWKSK